MLLEQINKISNTNSTEPAAAYLRVSTEDQEDNTSLPYQEECARKYAEDNKLKLDDNMVFPEVKPASRIEGKVLDELTFREYLSTRPALLYIMNLADLGKIKHLIVYSIDRFTRSFEDFYYLMDYFEKKHVQVHFSKPGEMLASSDKNQRKLLEVIKASLAEFEAEQISSRTRTGNQSRVKHGLWPGGRIPFGFKSKDLGNGRTTLEKSLYEAEIIKEVFELYEKGLGYRKIAQAMKNKYESMNWTKSKVEYIIKNKTYTGQIAWNRRSGRRQGYKKNDENIEGMIELSKPIKGAKIIEESLWNSVDSLRKSKGTPAKDIKYYSTPFLLRGKLFCGHCNSEMKCKNYGDYADKKRMVYRCNTCTGNGKSLIIIPKDDVENIFIREINQSIDDSFIDKLWKNYENEHAKLKNALKNKSDVYSARLGKIDDDINKLNFLIKSTEQYGELHEDKDDDDDTENDECSSESETDIEDNNNNPGNSLNSLNTNIKSILIRELTTLEIEKKNILQLVNNIDNSLKTAPLTEKKFTESFKEIITSFQTLNDFKIRQFIDIYIHRIDAFKDGDNITLKLIINPSREKSQSYLTSIFK
jgi:site-specific DNA recombinase